MEKIDKTPIKFCPNCKSDISKDSTNNKLAQNCKHCNVCNATFYIICTTEPK